MRGVSLGPLVMALFVACGVQERASAPNAPTSSGDSAASILRGRVTDDTGAPIDGARIDLVTLADAESAGSTCSQADGTFQLAVRVPGHFALAASASAYAPVFLHEKELEAQAESLHLVLSSEGMTTTGRVFGSQGEPLAGVSVRAVQWGNAVEGVFFTATDESGRYRFRLRKGKRYCLDAYGQRLVSMEKFFLGEAEERDLDLRAYGKREINRAAPPQFVTWLQKKAIRLVTSEPGAGVDDLLPLGAHLEDARVVGVGDATHGTSEFLRLRHRIIELLVTRLGFRAIVLEAPATQVLSIDAFVVDGVGSASAALAGVGFWSLDTVEVLDLIRWVRSHNSQRPVNERVHFYGVDPQRPSATTSKLVEYLHEMRNVRPSRLVAELAPLAAAERDPRAYRELSEKQHTEFVAALARTQRELNKSRRQYVTRGGAARWRLARHQLDLLRQADAMLRQQTTWEAIDVRDAAMARNLRWVVEEQLPGAKAIWWAHNGHVQERPFGIGNTSTGMHLARWLGSEYVSVGFAFGRGSLRARDGIPGPTSRGVIEHSVGPASKQFVEAALAEAGIPLFVVDLGAVSRDSAASWLRTPRRMRMFDAVFQEGSDEDWPLHRVDEEFDLLVFVGYASASHPTPSGRRGPGE